MKRNPISIRKIILIFLLCLVSSSIKAQKTDLDTLNFKQLNQYMVKADKIRNAGMILTFSGVGIVAAGYITSAIWSSSNSLEGWEVFKTLIPFYLGALIGIPISIVGIPLWAIGGIRNAKAEIALKKFDFKTNKSMAVGIRILISF